MDNSQVEIIDWNPTQTLKAVSLNRVKYSRGFVQCDPSKWFPIFAKLWTPLLNRFGLDLKVSSVTPTLEVSQPFQHAYIAEIDNEPIILGIANESYRVLIDAFIGAIGVAGREVFAEYLARRFLKSLSDSWAGAKSDKLIYKSEYDFKSVRPAATIEFKGTLAGLSFVFYVFIGKTILEHLDGLWRRQLHSAVVQNTETNLRVELAALWISPHRISDYLSPGAVIDLQATSSDEVNIYLANQPWKKAKMYNMQGKLALGLDGFPSISPAIAGATKLSFDLGQTLIDSHKLAEVAQNGAILDTDINLQSNISVMLNMQKIAIGKLGTYQGRWIVTIINPI